MIKEFKEDIKKIVVVSKEFSVEKVVLFGSCLQDVLKANDIDIAVSGIKDKDFFKYYGRLSMEVPDEIDLVDLKDLPDYFRNQILSKGKVLYERDT